jgi:hypothetical protein
MEPRASNRVLRFLQECFLGLQALLVEHRKARAASRLYDHLRTRSAEDLARAGIRREDLANEIHVRLYGGPKRS